MESSTPITSGSSSREESLKLNISSRSSLSDVTKMEVLPPNDIQLSLSSLLLGGNRDSF